ncbi:MAG: TIGR03032 family protein [Alphaproteobacteria bacterium]|nr:MAG: TIGR03032 family protein [Alphaproteobacteria bacterium]
MTQNQIPNVVQDRSVGNDGPFHIHLSDEARSWMDDNDLSLVFTTYTLGKVVMIGPGNQGSLSACERNLGRAMALIPTPNGFYLSTLYQIWRFEHSLDPGVRIENVWDRFYMPRSSSVTGNVDIHDMHFTTQEELLVAVTQYNCIASVDDRGSFNPLWRPSFIDGIFPEDRCHLNGFCLDGDDIAYVSVVSNSNKNSEWYKDRADGGSIIDAKSREIVCQGLSMPHTPRLYDGKLWFVEAGRGWFGYIDPQSGKFEHVCWCPGFLRGLRFFGKYALLGTSLPRNEVFAGLPLDDMLKERNAEPECAIFGIDLETGEIAFKIGITGSVTEIYDLIVLESTRQPMMIGIENEEIMKFVFLGPDTSGD